MAGRKYSDISLITCWFYWRLIFQKHAYLWSRCFFFSAQNHFLYYFLFVCRNAEPGQPLSEVVPISRNRLTPYRAVIIMRLIILGLFFHYRITNPVESAYGLWLTSVICEIWFAVSWVLDQFPKWSPINRKTYIDVLSARYTSVYTVKN